MKENWNYETVLVAQTVANRNAEVDVQFWLMVRISLETFFRPIFFQLQLIFLDDVEILAH
jgi:hypothetical protein